MKVFLLAVPFVAIVIALRLLNWKRDDALYWHDEDTYDDDRL